MQVKTLPLNAGVEPVVLLVRAERLARFTGQRVDEQGAGIVAGTGIVRAWISQANNHDDILSHLPLPSSVPELLLLVFAFLSFLFLLFWLFTFLGVFAFFGFGSTRLVNGGHWQVVIFTMGQGSDVDALR